MTTKPMTMAEKVLARTSGHEVVAPGDYVTARADLLMAHEAFTLCAFKLMELGIDRVFDPGRIAVVLDHYFPAPTERYARGHALARDFAERWGIANFLGYAGICHQVLVERALVRPGDLVFGTDSHSTTYGAIGAAGNGIGLTEATYLMATGELWMRVPPTIRFELEGVAGPGVMSKDVILAIAGRFGTEVAQYRSIEFGGALARHMSVASRLAMTNMGVELGAKFAMFAADEKTCAYLADRAELAEAAAAAAHEAPVVGGGPRMIEPFGPDPGCAYEAVHAIDVSDLEPQIACPHNPGNVRPVSQVEGTPVAQVFLGSCTNARLEDLAVAARILAGRKVHPKTRMIVTPASREVYLDALRAGYIETLMEAGAHVTASGCGACPGGHGGVVGPGEACLSSTNRNFRGRMGSQDAEVYLGSPASVAAAAITGEITDPRRLCSEPAL